MFRSSRGNCIAFYIPLRKTVQKRTLPQEAEMHLAKERPGSKTLSFSLLPSGGAPGKGTKRERKGNSVILIQRYTCSQARFHGRRRAAIKKSGLISTFNIIVPPSHFFQFFPGKARPRCFHSPQKSSCQKRVLSHTHTHTHTPTHTHSLSPPLSYTHILSHSLTHTLSYTHSLTHPLTHTHSHTLLHPHTHSHSPPLLPLSLFSLLFPNNTRPLT